MKQCILRDLRVSIWVFGRGAATNCGCFMWKKKLIISPTVTERWAGERGRGGGMRGSERLAHLILRPDAVWESLISCFSFLCVCLLTLLYPTFHPSSVCNWLVNLITGHLEISSIWVRFVCFSLTSFYNQEKKQSYCHLCFYLFAFFGSSVHYFFKRGPE